jgi:hypothetical protein
MMGFFFFTTQLLQGAFGFTAFQAGLGFLPMTVVNLAVATALPRIARQFGQAPVLVAGVGLAFAPLTTFGIIGVRAEDAGAASGLVNTFHQFGMALGLAVLVAASASAGDLTTRVARALECGSGLLAACLLVVLAVMVPARRRAATRAPELTEGVVAWRP